jgi:hypothetical protein
VTDGIWAKLDVFYIFATADSTTALLNLVSTSYSGIANGSPTFTTDRGFTGTMGSSTIYINTQWDPVTVPSRVFAQDSAHISVWTVTHVTNTGGNGGNLGQVIAGNQSVIFTRFADGNTYPRVTAQGTEAGFVDADGIGHYIANRTSGTTLLGYKNGTQTLSVASTSAPVTLNNNFIVLAYDDFSTGATAGSGSQTAGASIGGGLTGTDATNFYNRLRTYMTAVGVP